MKRALLVVFMLLVMGSIAMGATMKTVDIENLTSEARNEVLRAAKGENKLSPDEVLRWGMVGKAIGEAVHEAAKALSQDVNEFVKTPVGKLTMVLVVWKIVGGSFVTAILGVPMYIFLMVLLIWSYRRFQMSERIVDGDGRVTFIPRYDFFSSDAKVASAAVHVVVFILLNIVTIAIIAA